MSPYHVFFHVCICKAPLNRPVSSGFFLLIPMEDFYLVSLLARMNVDKPNGKNSERRKLVMKKKKSSALFPLTGNCVFDLSHHTHLVIACEVSLLPAAEEKEEEICYCRSGSYPGSNTRVPKRWKTRLHILINLGLRSVPDEGIYSTWGK